MNITSTKVSSTKNDTKLFGKYSMKNNGILWKTIEQCQWNNSPSFVNWNYANIILKDKYYL